MYFISQVRHLELEFPRFHYSCNQNILFNDRHSTSLTFSLAPRYGLADYIGDISSSLSSNTLYTVT